MDITFTGVVPILRIFDIAKADEFYLGFLGFAVDWDHRFEPDLPLYRQISRGGLLLHLSEHHGDGSPGAHVRIETRGVEAFRRELIGKRYNYGRPGVERTDWGTLEVSLYDPFGNVLVFSEPAARAAESRDEGNAQA